MVLMPGIQKQPEPKIAKTHYRSLNETTVVVPALAQPILGDLRRYEIRKILEDTSPTDELPLELGTVLDVDETYIDGATYTARVEPLKGLTLGFQQAMWIVEHQDELPARFNALRGKVCIDFRGLTVLGAFSRRVFPCVGCNGERWILRWDRIAYVRLYDGGRIAASGK